MWLSSDEDWGRAEGSEKIEVVEPQTQVVNKSSTE